MKKNIFLKWEKIGSNTSIRCLNCGKIEFLNLRNMTGITEFTKEKCENCKYTKPDA